MADIQRKREAILDGHQNLRKLIAEKHFHRYGIQSILDNLVIAYASLGEEGFGKGLQVSDELRTIRDRIPDYSGHEELLLDLELVKPLLREVHSELLPKVDMIDRLGDR